MSLPLRSAEFWHPLAPHHQDATLYLNQIQHASETSWKWIRKQIGKPKHHQKKSSLDLKIRLLRSPAGKHLTSMEMLRMKLAQFLRNKNGSSSDKVDLDSHSLDLILTNLDWWVPLKFSCDVVHPFCNILKVSSNIILERFQLIWPKQLLGGYAPRCPLLLLSPESKCPKLVGSLTKHVSGRILSYLSRKQMADKRNPKISSIHHPLCSAKSLLYKQLLRTVPQPSQFWPKLIWIQNKALSRPSARQEASQKHRKSSASTDQTKHQKTTKIWDVRHYEASHATWPTGIALNHFQFIWKIFEKCVEGQERPWVLEWSASLRSSPNALSHSVSTSWASEMSRWVYLDPLSDDRTCANGSELFESEVCFVRQDFDHFVHLHSLHGSASCLPIASLKPVVVLQLWTLLHATDSTSRWVVHTHCASVQVQFRQLLLVGSSQLLPSEVPFRWNEHFLRCGLPHSRRLNHFFSHCNLQLHPLLGVDLEVVLPVSSRHSTSTAHFPSGWRLQRRPTFELSRNTNSLGSHHYLQIQSHPGNSWANPSKQLELQLLLLLQLLLPFELCFDLRALKRMTPLDQQLDLVGDHFDPQGLTLIHFVFLQFQFFQPNFWLCLYTRESLAALTCPRNLLELH